MMILRLLQLLLFLTVAVLVLQAQASATLGVAYGRLGNNLPSLPQVVQLLQANHWKNVMIYDTDPHVLEAFMGSSVRLIVQATNGELQNLASSQAAANQWVQARIFPYASIIQFIAVGNEVLTSEPALAQSLYPAMLNIYNSLLTLNLSSAIKVSTTHAANVLDAASFPPSNGRFSSSVLQNMLSILGLLSTTGAPFMANVYPFLAYVGANGDIKLPYALLETAPGVGVTVADSGSGLVYTNLFDAQLDTLVSALEKVGYGGMPLVVTETGWPSGGSSVSVATVANAQTYVNNLVARISAGAGTPKRPSLADLHVYIFALFNENEKVGADYERHFGLFYPDQTMVYQLHSPQA